LGNDVFLLLRTYDDLFHADFADYADLIFEIRIFGTRISGFKDLEDFNRSEMNRIGWI